MMAMIYRGENYTVTTKASRLIFREQLDNGQYLIMWFWRKRANKNSGGIMYVWAVGVWIGNKKGAAHWRRKNQKIKQTGTCGLKGLKIALEQIQNFSGQIGWREELQIVGADTKRQRAYNWLLRYPGFTLQELYGQPIIIFRNPNYWAGESTHKKGVGEI